MERETKLKKKEKERESSVKRSPLQRLNGLHIRKPSTIKALNIPSSSSSSTTTHLHMKPKSLSLSKPANTAPLKSSAVASKARSKENQLPKKPMKNQLYSKSDAKPTIKNCPRSKLCSSRRNPVGKLKKGLQNCEENGSGELPIKLFEVFNDVNLNCIESKTFNEGKTNASVCGFLDASFDYSSQNVREGSISKTSNGESSESSVKTPPVEASVSPEIQSGSHSKMPVIKSAAVTPVCYGAGVHLLSGVTDKRKCRRRGSLKGGCEKFNPFDDDNEKNGGNVIGDSQEFSIPLPAEASVRWLLSPCEEGREDSESKLDQCSVIDGESASVKLDLSSSPSTLCRNVSNFGFGNSNKKMFEHLLGDFTSNCNSVGSGEGSNLRHDLIENNSAFSFGSLSSGNIIQTPSSGSGSGSYGCLRGSNVEFVQFELDSITKALNKVDLSPSRECADMDLSIKISLTQLQENVDGACSSVSDSTISENLALSQMRISWRDGLVSRIDENDELDCCRCLSDEEIDDDMNPDKKLCSPHQSARDDENDLAINSTLRSHFGTLSGANDYNDLISAQGKEKSSPHRLNASAESICTNGGDLVASGDSDWLYFRESRLY